MLGETRLVRVLPRIDCVDPDGFLIVGNYQMYAIILYMSGRLFAGRTDMKGGGVGGVTASVSLRSGMNLS